MTTVALDPATVDDVWKTARRVRRYPGHTGWPLYKPDTEPPNIPQRSTGPIHLNFDRTQHE